MCGGGEGSLSIISFLPDLTHKPLPVPVLQDSCLEELTVCEITFNQHRGAIGDEGKNQRARMLGRF